MMQRATTNIIRNASSSNINAALPQFYPNPYSSPFFPTNTQQISSQGSSNGGLNPGLLDGGSNHPAPIFNF